MFIVGNWKMHGLCGGLDEARVLASQLNKTPTSARVAICPPAVLIARLAGLLEGSSVEIGGQDCHAEREGAFTGDISGEMLRHSGARLVILGHSERRAGHGESDAAVSAKVSGALRAGLEPIICVGESLEEREGGKAEKVVTSQLVASAPRDLGGSTFSVAYEPIWAIGSGLTPTEREIGAMHAALRATLRQQWGDEGNLAPILYGGSVKPSNAGDIMRLPEVGGALVGGASLKASDFEAIIRAV